MFSFYICMVHVYVYLWSRYIVGGEVVFKIEDNSFYLKLRENMTCVGM